MCSHHECVSTNHVGEKRISDPLGLKLHRVASPMQLLEFEPWPSGRAANGLNCWAIALAPIAITFYRHYENQCAIGQPGRVMEVFLTDPSLNVIWMWIPGQFPRVSGPLSLVNNVLVEETHCFPSSPSSLLYLRIAKRFGSLWCYGQVHNVHQMQERILASS